MTIGTVKTQGTELWVIDTITSSQPFVLKFSCPTGITGLGGAADQIEDTCLDATEDRTYVRGLGNPGQVNVPFNFIPSNASHQALFDLKADGSVFQWLIGFSDGTAAPTLDSDDDFVPPASPLRTSAEFSAYISDVTIDVATNEIVHGTMILQRSGPVTWYWNGPTPT
jgi:hypothetical protein